MTVSKQGNILITGAAGFISKALTIALVKSSPNLILTLTVVIEPPVPPVTSLLSSAFTAAYLLHGLMSGGAEANLKLGWKVRWDIETYLNDFSRRDLLRFPAVIASHSPLRGENSVFPMTRDLEMWVCSPMMVVENLVWVERKLPGITASVRQILDALETVGGKEAVWLIEEARNSKVEAIVGSWPARFDIARAKELGMEGYGMLEETVTAVAESLKQWELDLIPLYLIMLAIRFNFAVATKGLGSSPMFQMR
ncbi:uncharacterized protein BCR38DRAFT_456665 [Pseudomassariella vexata]|uniref:Uncharacterized protein n=1 Tax=Pseudomassariella vexata TaxID=1141098 RepID=A0A1Y2E374_9PEZI|nr:uncharacterized protein BCR38DRAFT_456665 [Pseudomassariella vexata]ORY66000.1 hypothetical protein BCR38DRAFT_456665 [Pseudomassariella vexata]